MLLWASILRKSCVPLNVWRSGSCEKRSTLRTSLTSPSRSCGVKRNNSATVSDIAGSTNWRNTAKLLFLTLNSQRPRSYSLITLPTRKRDFTSVKSLPSNSLIRMLLSPSRYIQSHSVLGLLTDSCVCVCVEMGSYLVDIERSLRTCPSRSLCHNRESQLEIDYLIVNNENFPQQFASGGCIWICASWARPCFVRLCANPFVLSMNYISS